MRYEIDENNAVRMYNDGDTVPFMYQPDYPNLDKFDTKEEAKAWAELAMSALLDVTAPHAPIGKGIAGEAKIIKETKNETSSI